MVWGIAGVFVAKGRIFTCRLAGLETHLSGSHSALLSRDGASGATLLA
jgi:hypothetical protein